MLLSLLYLSAQTYEWAWATRAGGTSLDKGVAIAVDTHGNSYVTGHFNGAAQFGSITLTSNGNDEDIFAAKLNSSGEFEWAIRAGGTHADYGYGIAVDSSANVYLTGYFRGTANFGHTTLISDENHSKIFVAKLDSNGGYLWAVQAGGTNNNYGKDIAVDGLGNVYIMGSYHETVTFGTITLTCAGWGNIYAAKLDSGGNFLWAVSGGSIAQDYTYAYGLALDSAANIYLTGNFLGTAIFGSTTLISSGSGDIYAAKLDNNDNFLWAVKAGGSAWDYATDIAVDSAANVYLTGYFEGMATFGPTTFTSLGENDIYASKLDSLGNFLWTVRAGGPYINLGYSIAVDDSANAYLTGAFYGTVNFGSYSITSAGWGDIYVAKLDSLGNFLWAVRAGESANNDTGSSIAVDTLSNLYLTGYFNGSVIFGSHLITSNGGNDVFIAKYSTEPVGTDDETAPGIQGLSALLDAYPNPFQSGSTANIKTLIADRETGTLSLYNLRGQLIAKRTLSAGTHEINLTTSDLAPGVYFYQLRTPSVKIVKKLVLFK